MWQESFKFFMVRFTFKNSIILFEIMFPTVSFEGSSSLYLFVASSKEKLKNCWSILREN